MSPWVELLSLLASVTTVKLWLSGDNGHQDSRYGGGNLSSGEKEIDLLKTDKLFTLQGKLHCAWKLSLKLSECGDILL